MKPPWDKAKGKILFRQSELSIWTGVNGHGKSQFLGQIALHTLKQEIPVCIASLELPPARLLVRMARQAAAMERPSPAYIQAIHAWYSDKLWLFDLTGTAKTERLLEVFLYARQRYNVTVFIIDSLMKCGISEDDYTAQKLFVEKLCDFKNQHDCHIHLIAHPRKSEDEKHMPGKYDIKGTGAIVDLADNCFTVWRNKSKEQAIEKTQMTGQEPTVQMLEKIDCLWGCDKQRNGEWEGKIGLWFDKKSFQYLDYQSKKPTRMVEYSCLNNNSEEK
jgi:twinkle protein